MSSVVAVVDVGVVDFVFANNWATPDSDQNFFLGGEKGGSLFKVDSNKAIVA